MLPEKMETSREEEIQFITDEKFDFGQLSPSDSREEECLGVEEKEGVFAGPVQQVERFVVQRIDPNVVKEESIGPRREHQLNWSPLSPEKLEEIVKEANWLATQLEGCHLPKENAHASPREETELSLGGEPRAPFRFLSKERESPRSPRRETFVVKNSPVRALLPTVELGTLLSKGKSPSPRTAVAPPHARLRHRAGSRLAGGERPRKESTPSKAQPPQRLASSKKPSFQDNPNRRTSPSIRVKEARGPRSSPTQPRLKQELSSPRGKAESLQIVNTGPAKPCGGNSSQVPTSSRPTATSTCQARARSTAIPIPASRLPVPTAVPKPASRVISLSQAAVPRKSSQPQLLGQGSAGAKGLLRPSASGQRVSVTQRTTPQGALRGSKLEPPKKVTVASRPR
ncbi:proline/serine-rich coiled-coil protein 1 [Alligator mississippiensis]|uniref:proline/serine-rich coiled-coil protein 1 n=1 Tax=Alligator mississippiensis TaxID=8496 RepID=UPI002877E0EF|nr:proline/serine-rich coiled-coil protein 1 [Alligator mississippiensis]